MKKKLNLIGYALGVAAGNPGCADGPEYVKKSKALDTFSEHILEWIMLKPNLALTDKVQIVQETNQALANVIESLIKADENFVVIGGDHSSGIGTWSGAAKALQSKGDLGLIWIDAHLDAHSFATSHSGNIHGMPVAALLGHGDKRLTQLHYSTPKIKPENLCLIGIRSFEAAEQKLLEDLGVKIYYMEEVNTRGLAVVWAEALQRVKKNTAGFGISCDLDGLDPQFASGVGTPVPNGLDLPELILALQDAIKDPKYVGFEIAEFNPHECFDEKTLKTIITLLQALCAKEKCEKII